MGRSLVSGAGQPSRHFNSEDECPISEGTIRKGWKGLPLQGSDAFLSFSPLWLTARRNKALYCFLSFSTHIRLGLRQLLIKLPCSDCMRPLQSKCLSNISAAITLEVSASRAAKWYAWFSQRLKSCWELLKSTFSAAGCCLQVVFPPETSQHRASG